MTTNVVKLFKDKSLTDSDPVTLTDPVNWCVLDNILPNTLDPVIYSLEDVIS